MNVKTKDNSGYQWDVIGHGYNLRMLDLAILNSSVSHGYVFGGVSGIGKAVVARKMISRLLGVSEHMLESHPDYVFIGLEENSKTHKMKEKIGIEQIRDARDRLTRSSMAGGWRCLLIEDADRMSVGASNALLKTLEEPSKDVCIVLIASSIDKLLPTIKSRVQILKFNPVPVLDVAEALVLGGASERDAELFSVCSAGRVGVAFSMFKNEDGVEDAKGDVAMIKACLSRDVSKRVLAVRKLIPDGIADHVVSRGVLADRVSRFGIGARDELLSAVGCSDLMMNKESPMDLSVEQAVLAVRGSGEVNKQLEMHINPKMALINLMLNIG